MTTQAIWEKNISATFPASDYVIAGLRRFFLKNSIRRVWDTLCALWERQELPPKTQMAWECKYCQYQTDCLPGG
jgi:hypothetical protein